MKQEARPGDGLESPGFSRGEEVKAMGAPEYAKVVDDSTHRDEEIQRLKKRIAMLESVS